MNDYPLVSVIVPVYNSQAYFEACIKSIVDQSYRNLEIILVNDGSTDSTPNIIQRYAAIDPRIIVINKENEGTQYARRDGIKVATGKYIQNVDCDDALFPDAIEHRVRRAEETGADIVASPFLFCPEDSDSFPSTPLNFDTISGIEYFREVCYRRAYWATWTILHKRSLYINNSIQCDPEIMMTEDTILTTQLALYSIKVVSCPHPVVRFTVRSSSLSNKKTISDDRFRDLRKYPLWIANFITKMGLEEELQQEIGFLNIRVAFESFAKSRYEYAKEDMSRMKKIVDKYPVLKKQLTRRERKILTVYKLCPRLGMLNLYRYRKQKKI